MPHHFWSDDANVREYMQWLAQQLQIKTLDDWYRLCYLCLPSSVSSLLLPCLCSLFALFSLRSRTAHTLSLCLLPSSFLFFLRCRSISLYSHVPRYDVSILQVVKMHGRSILRRFGNSSSPPSPSPLPSSPPFLTPPSPSHNKNTT